MNIYTKKRVWKLLLLTLALSIAGTSLWYTDNLVKKLAIEEKKKVELVANATKNIISPTSENVDFSFSFKVIQDNNTVPVILTDDKGNVLSSRNLDSVKSVNDSLYLKEILLEMKEYNDPIPIFVADGMVQYIYFKPSVLIDLLQFYPYLQLAMISIFILIAYLAFSYARNAEQNQVWVGMSKETAHQLATPLSSLYGWLEILKSSGIDSSIQEEINKDLDRLSSITNRFSKIGSQPVLSVENLDEVLAKTIDYLKSRLSKQVIFTYSYNSSKTKEIPLNIELFEWVIENLCKNATDAMNGKGTITITVSDGAKNQLYIDVKDSGKGIVKSEFTKVFKPGFTSKKRGWGLGLSLAKRIIETYHSGKIYVKYSEIGIGTTFRISLYPTQLKVTKNN